MSKKKLPLDPEPRPRFTFLRQWYDVIQDLEPEAAKQMLLAIVEYAFDLKEPCFTDKLSRIIWKQVITGLNYGWMKYNAGKLGGAPKGNTNALRFKDKSLKNDGPLSF